tara:strand:- start:5136 stop:5297 length:162 start_codon:yes stop_codon:yes gene_type:complete
MEQLTAENLYILWLAAKKLAGIWWPVIAATIIMLIHTYVMERREQKRLLQKRD